MKITNILRGIFLENAYYKLFSVLLVALLYAWVLGDRDSEIAVFAPVRVATPDRMVLINQPPTQVQVTVRGRWNTLQRFGQQGELSPVILRPDAKEGIKMLRLEANMFEVPSGLQVTDIQPTFVRTELRPRAAKRVPLRVRTVGKPADGHSLGEITLEPTMVEINGPREEVLRTRFVTTEPIDITDKKKGFSEELELRYDSPHIRDDLTRPVIARVPIRAIEVDRRVEGLPVVAVNTSKRVELSPSKVTITVRGPRALVDALKLEDVLASIDLAGINSPGLYQKQVKISNIPQGVTLVGTFPTDFQVKVNAPPVDPE